MLFVCVCLFACICMRVSSCTPARVHVCIQRFDLFPRTLSIFRGQSFFLILFCFKRYLVVLQIGDLKDHYHFFHSRTIKRSTLSSRGRHSFISMEPKVSTLSFSECSQLLFSRVLYWCVWEFCHVGGCCKYCCSLPHFYTAKLFEPESSATLSNSALLLVPRPD